MREIRIDPFGWAVLVSAALIVGIVPRSFAADGATNPAAAPFESTSVQPGPFRPGLAIGGWMVYPSIFLGAVFDDNVRQSANDIEHTSGLGVRVAPDLIATYDGGIHQTTLYGVVDARFFPGVGTRLPGEADANSVAATAGFRHGYQPLPDLGVSIYGDYTRQTDIFNSALNFNNSAIGPTPSSSPAPIILNPFGMTPTVNPVASNQFTGGGAVTKTVGQGFVSLGGAVAHIAFDHTNSPFQIAEDGTIYFVTGRFGYNVTPALYVFAEPSGIFQHVNNSTTVDTSGYRVVGGIGSADPNSLFRGEIWGGYQAQHEDVTGLNSALLNGLNTNSGVFGASLAYYPTRYWTVMALAQESLGVTMISSAGAPVGTPTRTITAILQTTYHLSLIWSVGARAGYTRAEYIGTARLDNGWMAGASFNYEVWRNLLLTLDYQHSSVHSNFAFSSFEANIYSAGLTYQY